MIQLTIASSNQKEEYEEELLSGIPICGSNLSTPVVDQAYHTDEIHYCGSGNTKEQVLEMMAVIHRQNTF